MNSNRSRWFLLSTIAVLMFLSFSSVFAAEPAQITLAPTWRPGTTLDTIDQDGDGTNDIGTDDFRYIDVDIYVTTTVQFWSVQLTCTVSPTALTSYDNPNTDGDANNTAMPVIWGPMWGSAAEFANVIEPYNAATGARTITATVLGNRPMLGSVGPSTLLRIATLRYRAKDVNNNTTSPFTCTSAFLNRNGQSVMTATYAAPTPLNVLTGYVISGTTLYQGRTVHTGIDVACTGPATVPPLKTTAAGAWSALVRAQGVYSCEFYGNINNATAGYQPDRYLAASTSFMVSGLSYSVLPITLGGGNLDIPNPNAVTKTETINSNDVTIITMPANWNKSVTAGDINGDGKTNQADLALLGTNYGQTEIIDARHAIYSVPRNIDAWQNSRVWMGRMDIGAVTPLVPNTTPDSRDLWPTISPDGKQIAFVRDVNMGTGASTALYVAPLTNGVVGTPVRLTPLDAWYQAFAPSWSPDSTRIAFVCAEFEDGSNNNGVASGHLANIGSLCVIDATGRNWREFATTGAKAKIYPPAWITNTQLVYGGSAPQAGASTGLNVTCANTLCYFDLLTNQVAVFDANVTNGGSGGTTIQDMPVIRGDQLFYRFYDNNNTAGNPNDDSRLIRWAILQRAAWDGTTADLNDLVTTFGTMATSQFHLRVENNPGFTPISTEVDYYNVNASRYDIVYYTSSSPDFMKSLVASGNGTFTRFMWSIPVINKVDELQPSPNNPDHTPYDYTDGDTGDYRYGYRNTVEWTP